MRRALQATLIVLSIIPLAFGILNLLYGSSRFLPEEAITAAMDSQFRFQSAWYLGLAALIIWILPRIERETTLFRGVIFFIFLGGLGRVWVWVTVGAPPPMMQAATILELMLPLLIPLQSHVRRLHESSASHGTASAER